MTPAIDSTWDEPMALDAFLKARVALDAGWLHVLGAFSSRHEIHALLVELLPSEPELIRDEFGVGAAGFARDKAVLGPRDATGDELRKLDRLVGRVAARAGVKASDVAPLLDDELGEMFFNFAGRTA